MADFISVFLIFTLIAWAPQTAHATSPSSGPSSDINTCTLEQITDNCKDFVDGKQMKTDPFHLVHYSDGTALDSVYGIKNSREMFESDQKNFSAERATQVENIFSVVVGQIIAKITDAAKGRPLSKNEQALINKLRDVRLEEIDKNNPDYISFCRDGSFSEYIPASNRFYICPTIAASPTTSLIFVIAHELSHVIDPCASSQNTYYGTYQALDNEHAKLDKLLASLKDQILNQAHGDTRDGLLKLYCSQYDRKLAVEKLMASHAPFLSSTQTPDQISPVPAVYTLVKNGVPPNQYPFKKTLSCLEESTNSYAFNPTPENIHNVAQATMPYDDVSADDLSTDDPFTDRCIEAKATRSAEERERDHQAQIKNREEYIKSVGPFCSSELTGDQRREVFADWMGAEIEGAVLKAGHANFKVHPLDKYAPISFMVASACAEYLGKAKPPKAPNSHMSAKDRLEKIILANPDIRRAIGCKSNAKPCGYTPFISPDANSTQDISTGGNSESTKGGEVGK